MGLYLYPKESEDGVAMSIGYGRFAALRREIVKAAYGELMCLIYDVKVNAPWPGFTPAELLYWEQNSNNDLEPFIWHPDCDGEMTSEECEKTYNTIKDLTLNTEDEGLRLRLKELKQLLKYCAENNETLVFG